jgi:hypothetical protein
MSSLAFLVAAYMQPLRNVKSDKSGGAGDQNLHVELQPPVGLIRSKQVFDVVKHV